MYLEGTLVLGQAKHSKVLLETKTLQPWVANKVHITINLKWLERTIGSTLQDMGKLKAFKTGLCPLCGKTRPATDK